MAPVATAIVTVVAVPILSLLLYSVWSTPPTDFGTGSMFDQIAPRYDLINRFLALNLDMGWRRRQVQEVLGSDVGEFFASGDEKRILDLATGTADVAILLGKEAMRYEDHLRPRSTNVVLGVDPSQNMIDVGRSKVSAAGLSGIVALELGDARNLDGIASDSFDAATMSFGIRNVPERDVALCEIHRVMKKETREGGRGSKLGILEFSEPSSDAGFMGIIARMFIRHVVPLLGAVLSGAPREYMHLQNSIKEFPSPDQFVALMEGLACGDDGAGKFQVEQVIQMNFGSVQLYVAKPVVR